MNTFNFIPKVFDARFHGVVSYEAILAYHKENENLMPIDGIVFACEHGHTDQLRRSHDKLITQVRQFEALYPGLPYEAWTCLDRFSQFSRARLQLINAYFNR